MKKNLLYKGVAAILVAGTLTAATSCNDNYLELAPITSPSAEQATSTVEALSSSYYGVIEAMYCPYTNFSGGPLMCVCQGEAGFMKFFGESGGQDEFQNFWNANGFGGYVINWNTMNLDNFIFGYYGYEYAYTLIGMCNQLLDRIDNTTGDPAVVQYIKAGLLTIRAHGYYHLLQLFAPRWEDSRNGEELVLVLRTTSSTADLPLSSMNDVLDLCYSDLNEAIKIFNSTSVKRSSSERWEANVDVAYGVFARVAMLKHDYALAQKMANLARADYSLMSAEQYKEGFVYENSEYMWTNIYDSFIGYYSFGAWWACNGAYPCYWGNIGAGAISYDLYKQMSETDVRRDLFWTPDKTLDKRLKPEDFWNEKVVNALNMGLYTQRPMIISVDNFRRAVHPSTVSSAYPAYESQGGDDMYIPFGAQFKFWGEGEYSTCQFPFMRASEMLLNEAECAYENGDFATAKACLQELHAQRNVTTSVPDSGTALRDAIRLERRIELWGEGFSWFDLKRWNVSCTRRAWVAGDPESGNWPAAYAGSINPQDFSGWRYAIPINETQYNPLVK